MKKTITALLLILLLASAARAYRIGHGGLWTDELCSVEASSGLGLTHLGLPVNEPIAPPPDLISLGPASRWLLLPKLLIRDDNHPPLYFYLLRLWRALFGDSEAAMRSLSVLACIVGIVCMYDAVRLAEGESAARWTALLMTFSGPFIQFSQEVRGYMLMAALGCAAMSAMVRIARLGANRKRIVALAAAALAMMLTHYYAAGPLIGLTIYSLLGLRSSNRMAILASLVIAGIVFVVVWGIPLVHQHSHWAATTAWEFEPANGHVQRTFSRMGQLPLKLLNDPMQRMWMFTAFGALIYLLPLLRVRRQPTMLLWWCWLCGSIGICAATDLARGYNQLDFSRYTLEATPALCAILASIAAQFRRPIMRHIVPAAALLSCLISLPRVYNNSYAPRKPNWRSLINEIETSATNGDDLLVLWSSQPSYDGFCGITYMGLQYYLHQFPPTVLVVHQQPSEGALQRIRSSRSVLITNFVQPEFPQFLRPPGWKMQSMPLIVDAPVVWRITPPL